jgi:hypothetical protein
MKKRLLGLVEKYMFLSRAWKWLPALMLLALSSAAQAQTVPAPYSDLQALESWLATQKAYVGTGFSLHGVKYASTYYDLISIGQSGLNIAKPTALDYIDFGPSVNVANGTTPRYGMGIPIHAANIWNSLSGKVPATISSHVSLVSLPDIIISPEVLWPSESLGKWTWGQDFLLVLAVSFGGGS